MQKKTKDTGKSDMDKYEKYLMYYMEDYISNLVYNVLQNSKEDPHYSAVTATNLIKCYLKVMKDKGIILPYNTIKEFFEYYGFTNQEYEDFEHSRLEELPIYVGEIF